MSSVMEYNGYRAKVEYDSDDGIFVGEVLGINDMVGFHGASVKELKASFENTIENYVDACRQIGKKPEKEFKGTFNIRISPEAHRGAVEEAAAYGVTLNQFVADAIDEKIARARAGI